MNQSPESERPDLTHVRTMWANDPASAALGIDVVDLGVHQVDGQQLGHATTRMVVRDTMVNGHGMAHGGFLFTLADSTFALACNATGKPTVAATCDITYLAPARAGDLLIARAKERITYGRNGITDVTVCREGDGAVLAEFRGRSRTLASG